MMIPYPFAELLFSDIHHSPGGIFTGFSFRTSPLAADHRSCSFTDPSGCFTMRMISQSSVRVSCGIRTAPAVLLPRQTPSPSHPEDNHPGNRHRVVPSPHCDPIRVLLHNKGRLIHAGRGRSGNRILHIGCPILPGFLHQNRCSAQSWSSLFELRDLCFLCFYDSFQPLYFKTSFSRHVCHFSE